MVKGYVKEVVYNTDGEAWYRAEDSMGREYVGKADGEDSGHKGYMSGKGGNRWRAAKSHTYDAERERGNSVPDDPDELAEPFDTTIFTPIEAFERGSIERAKAAERNRFYGFLKSSDTPDDRIEAVKEYTSMVDELKDADSPEEERKIKRDYGIGDSG